MIGTILGIICAAVNLYSLLCIASILLTWFPGAKYTKFGRILSSITDPYLSLFSKKGRLVFGNIDFSPIVAIAILSLTTSILSRVAVTGRIYIGGILASIIAMVWSVCSTFLSIFFIFILIRWIVLLVKHGEVSYDSAWYRIDEMLQKPVYKISKTFVKKPLSYQKALLVSWISLLAVSTVGSILIKILETLCYKLPI